MKIKIRKIYFGIKKNQFLLLYTFKSIIILEDILLLWQVIMSSRNETIIIICIYSLWKLSLDNAFNFYFFIFFQKNYILHVMYKVKFTNYF